MHVEAITLANMSSEERDIYDSYLKELEKSSPGNRAYAHEDAISAVRLYKAIHKKGKPRSDPKDGLPKNLDSITEIVKQMACEKFSVQKVYYASRMQGDFAYNARCWTFMVLRSLVNDKGRKLLARTCAECACISQSTSESNALARLSEQEANDAVEFAKTLAVEW